MTLYVTYMSELITGFSDNQVLNTSILKMTHSYDSAYARAFWKSYKHRERGLNYNLRTSIWD